MNLYFQCLTFCTLFIIMFACLKTYAAWEKLGKENKHLPRDNTPTAWHRSEIIYLEVCGRNTGV